jgi:alkaline phosphatase/streptomycin-6-phosphatase
MWAVDRTAEIRASLDAHRARNVILLIGDGMGDAELTMARYYYAGAGGQLNIDRFTFTGDLTTYAVEESDPKIPDYVPDSASTASAWATGMKTSDRRISTSASSDLPLETILELAQENGLRTGVVTTSNITDASPAALAAHVNHRKCAGPADMEKCAQYRKAAGGLGSIAEQMVDHKIDVLLGGGLGTLAQTIDAGEHAGRTVIESAAAQGYQLVYDTLQLAAVDSLKDGPLLGLFAGDHLKPRWSGELAMAYPCSGPQQCVTGQRPAEQPTLAAMTRKALQLLEGEDGFFLQVEGALIDKCAHAIDPCGQIGETIDFDEAVGVANAYAAAHPDTLVIVTADHAQSSQMVDWMDERDYTRGFCSRLTSLEGAEIKVVYATNVKGRIQQHLGTQVRVAARGPRAANVLGLIDQTDLYFLMGSALGLINTPEAGFAASP